MGAVEESIEGCLSLPPHFVSEFLRLRSPGIIRRGYPQEGIELSNGVLVFGWFIVARLPGCDRAR